MYMYTYTYMYMYMYIYIHLHACTCTVNISIPLLYISLRRPLGMPRCETVFSQLYNWKVVRSEMPCLRTSQFGILKFAKSDPIWA